MRKGKFILRFILQICLALYSCTIFYGIDAAAAGREIKSCAQLQTYMQQSGYHSLSKSSYKARYKIANKVRDTIVTQYFMRDGSRFATYSETGKGKYAFGYDQDLKKPVDLFCYVRSGNKKANTSSLWGRFTKSGGKTARSSSGLSWTSGFFKFSAPRDKLNIPRQGSGAQKHKSGSSWGEAGVLVVLTLLGAFIAASMVFSTFGGGGGLLPNALWQVIITLALPVFFLVVNNYFGQRPESVSIPGGVGWAMIALAAIVIFISGIFARRIWFSLIQAVLMWFVIEFSDRIFEFDRTGAQLAKTFIDGKMDSLVYMALCTSMAYGLFIGILNKFESINADLKSIFVR